MKSSTSFVCQECGYESPEWLGKCPECGEWNTLREFKVKNEKLKVGSFGSVSSIEERKPQRLSEVKFQEKQRLHTGFTEVDNVLGGGIVRGSVILLAGDPGIGKSTLLLQVALNVAGNNKVVLSEAKDPMGQQGKPKKEILRSTQNDNLMKVLYISGEESEEQIKIRAERIKTSIKEGQSLYLLATSSVENVVSSIEEIKPALVIIDSIQTMESQNLAGLSGSIGQIRFATAQFIRLAKGMGIPIVMIGHVTKEGMVAGPMVLSHMVDTVLFLEGEKSTQTRILRSFKNRFGPADEVGIFAMYETGLKEISDPNSYFLGSREEKNLTGSVLVVTVEGTRAFLVEVQALSILSKMPFPRRVASGVDARRLELLLSVLQKHVNIPTYSLDIFVNVAGGLKISDPAADLGICLAIASSFKNIPSGNTVAIAEVGLLGELRNVPIIEKRTREAKKLGFKKIITAANFATLRDAVEIFTRGRGGNA